MKQSPLQLPALTQFSSRKEWVRACWKRIVTAKHFPEFLVTPHERNDIVMRVAIMNAVHAGRGVRQTARDLDVSLQTINAAKKALKETAYKSYWERGKTERKRKVYSRMSTGRAPIKIRGRRVRTKYGTLHSPL